MYNELAVTYESSSHFDQAISCIKKQLSIFEALGQTESLDYVVANIYLAQLLQENGQVSQGVGYLETAIEIEERLMNRQNRDEQYELILNLKMLADF